MVNSSTASVGVVANETIRSIRRGLYGKPLNRPIAGIDPERIAAGPARVERASAGPEVRTAAKQDCEVDAACTVNPACGRWTTADRPSILIDDRTCARARRRNDNLAALH